MFYLCFLSSTCFQKNGFFIEAGAWDGEQLSNTLYLEVLFIAYMFEEDSFLDLEFALVAIKKIIVSIKMFLFITGKCNI